GGASTECAPTSGTATVFGGSTTEVLLVSQCKGDPNGGLDARTALNDPPQIDRIKIDPSKFVPNCEGATLRVSASDPNGDAIDYTWAIISGPAGATLAPSGSSAKFHGDPGDYTLSVTATDIYGAATSLTFPIHVTSADCCNQLLAEDFSDNSAGWTLD